MAGTIIVGVILALMFLVAFSEWFFHLASGVNELIPSGFQFYTRLFRWILMAFLFMAMVFWTLSMVYECPRGNKRKGVFALMDCTVYWEIRARLVGVPASTLQEGLNSTDEFYY